VINAKRNNKYHSDDLLNFCAIYEAQDADNAKMLGIRYDDKLRKVYATNDFTIVRRLEWCL